MTKHYELTYTVLKNTTPEEANALFEKVLAYFPQAAVSEKGYDFFNLEFYAEPETLQDLDKKMKSEPQIEKFMITRKEAVKILKTRVRKTPVAPKETETQEKKVEKTELKEIDKKLKEIFGE